VVWDLPLQGDPGGPSSISGTAPLKLDATFNIDPSFAFVAHADLARLPWSGCLLRAVDVPWVRNTFEVVNTVIGEREPGTGDEIDDGPRYENLISVGEG
jgi:hypothetical protein